MRMRASFATKPKTQVRRVYNLKQRYEADVALGATLSDPRQLTLIEKLQPLLDYLIAKESPSLFSRIFRCFSWALRKKPMRGIYLWGTVGAGKTYLMDLFYQTLPTRRKMRLHFHHFMKEVHENLANLQGHPEPLRVVARRFSMRTRLLCLDECIVNDIVDAMLLGRLFQFLFDREVILFVTSNRPPDDLYLDGLQRELFLPAIALLKTHCQVIQLSSEKDYRWRALQKSGVYFTPLNAESEQHMKSYFDAFAKGSGQINTPLIIHQRSIATLAQGKSIVWFEFKVLCSPPRSQLDYLAIAKQFSVILISGVPIISPEDERTACYWIELIDILYDNHTLLILSAEAPLETLYPTGKKQFEFERTLSRLVEMQSVEYKEHCLSHLF